MAKKSEPLATPPSVSPAKGIELLERRYQEGNRLLENRPLSTNDNKAWRSGTRHFLQKAFGSDSNLISDVLNAGQSRMYMQGESETVMERERAANMEAKLTVLKSVIDILRTEIELESPNGYLPPEEALASQSLGNEIFLVHGHDTEVLHEAARFLEKLDLKVTILHERPNKGRTIIEKFEDYSNVGFAVVFLTKDDMGGPIDDSPNDHLPRARQNVILELGFFLGKLGRERVCPLYVEGVEIPSDYSGVTYVKLDNAGAWKMLLAREIKEAGIAIDLNKAL